MQSLHYYATVYRIINNKRLLSSCIYTEQYNCSETKIMFICARERIMSYSQLKFLCLSLTVVALISIGLIQSSLGKNDNPNGIRDLLVGQCIEEAKDTSVDYQCKDPQTYCNKQTVTKTYSLSFSVSGSAGSIKVLEAGVGGGVSYSYDVDNGCDDPAGEIKSECQQAEGVTFTEFPGDMVGLHKRDCSDYTIDDCMPLPGSTQEIPAPQSLIDALNLLLAAAGHSQRIQPGATFKVPVVGCGVDQIGVTTGTCPGTNGGQTYYKVSGELCNAGT